MNETRTRLTPHEAAHYIGCKYDKLMQLCRLKKITHYKIGSRYLFTKEALDLWIENQERQSMQTESNIRMVIR